MSPGIEFDEKMAARLEALYQTNDAAKRRAAVLAALRLSPGERVIDIGTGPGFVAYEMADAVGPSGTVVGVDTSDPMLQLATRRCAEKPWVRFEPGDASQLPAPDARYDAAVSVQVYEYIADVDVPIGEMYRVLRPGGRGVIVSTDWKSVVWRTSDEERGQRIMAAFAEHCAHQDLPRWLAPRLRSAGFRVVDQQVVSQFNPTYEPDSFSYRVIPAVQSFIVGRQVVTAEEAAAWAEDLGRLSERGEYFFSLSQYLYAVEKPGS
jgi:arsenite methyltransferase